MIKKAVKDHQDKGKPFYKYIFVDLDDVTIIIERFGRKLKKILEDAGIKPDEVKRYAFCSTVSEKIE